MIPENEPLQFSCATCLRLHYVGNVTWVMREGTLRVHRWRPYFRSDGKKTKCSFCGEMFRYLFCRGLVPDLATGEETKERLKYIKDAEARKDRAQEGLSQAYSKQ